jgi:hypothetical protein
MIDLLNRIGFKQVAFGGGDGGGGGTNTPLETTISNQPHALAYITPSEEGLLRSLGGTGQAGPGGVPAFPPTNQYSSAAYVDSKGREFGRTYSSDPNQKPTQVDKITDVAGYGDQGGGGGGGGGGGNKTLTPVAATPLLLLQSCCSYSCCSCCSHSFDDIYHSRIRRPSYCSWY